jgi:histidine triad (HIT) family protein
MRARSEQLGQCRRSLGHGLPPKLIPPFFPLNPAIPGHTLVVPRTHVAYLWEVEPALGAELTSAVIRVGRSIEAALAPEDLNRITSAGQMAEQTVFQLHLHVEPRWHQDGFGGIWPLGGKYKGTGPADTANRIRAVCPHGFGAPHVAQSEMSPPDAGAQDDETTSQVGPR